MNSDYLAEEIEKAYAGVVQDVPDPASVVARGRRLRFRDRVVRSAVGLLAALAVLAPLVALMGLNQTPPPIQAGNTPLESGGVFVEVISGWKGRFYEVPGFTRDVLILSNEELPFDLGPSALEIRGSLDTGDDALVWMVDVTSLCPPCDGFSLLDRPLHLEADDLTGYSIPETSLPAVEPVADHASARVLFKTQERFFDVRVEFGSSTPTGAALEGVNDILASIQIEPSVAPESQSCVEPGSFLDPDCPDHGWLVRILRAGGLEVVGDTGTALTATSDTLSINAFIAVTAARVDAYPIRTEVQGTRVAMVGADISFWNTKSGRQVWLRDHSLDGRLDLETLHAIVIASNAEES